MKVPDNVAAVMTYYPRIYFACHTRHVRDPRTNERLSAHQASILDHLDEVTPIALASLADHMGVTPSTMSLAITRLVALGYVSRHRDKRDGRSVELRLTAAGARVREAKSVLDPDRVARMLAHLGRDDRRVALHGLSLLAKAADRAMQDSSRARRVARGRRS